MIKTILVPVSGNETDTASLTTALRIAQEFGAHIDVLHVRMDPVDIAVAMTSDTGGGPLVAEVIEQLERDASARAAKARRIFEDFYAREKLALLEASASAQWHIETGDEARWITAYGLTADLTVAGRGGNEDVKARSVLETALLETGRPLLIPSRMSAPAYFGGTVAIAWKPTCQAARAVSAAMPFLARAKEVIVMTVEDGNGSADTDRLMRYLAWHGFRTNADRLVSDGREAVEVLLSAAAERAGLLVMGGYGHSRVREWLFGGFTYRVLDQAPVPVLLAH